MAQLTSSLIVKLIDGVTAPAARMSKSLLGLNKASSGSFGTRLTGAINSNNAALSRARGRLFDAAAGFYALKGAIAAPVTEAMNFESAMADVRKVVNFDTPQGFTDFKTQLLELSRSVPQTVNGLAEIAAAAGQAGIAREDLIKFTDAAAKIGVAFDISADQSGDALAKLMTGLGLTVDQAVLLSDSMNNLSNSQASSAAEILDVVRRVGAQAKLYGFTAEQTAAFASAMIAAGAESQVAATSFRNMGMALTRGASATKRQREAFKDLGMDAKTVAADMQRDAVGTTTKVLEALSKLPKESQGAVASNLFGNEARALGPLLTNLDLVKKSIGLVSDEADYAGSSFKEFQIRSNTFANRVSLFNNRLSEMKITIGNALIPALTDLMAAITPVIEAVGNFAAAHPELTRNVLVAAGSLVAFKIAMAGLTFVGLLGKGGALSLLSIGFNTIGKSAIGASRAAKAAVGLQAALAGMSGVKMGGLETMGVALRGMAMAVPGVSAIGTALTAVGAALAAVSAPVWGTIAIAVAAVGAAGFTLWKYWDRVSSVFGGVASRIGEELQPALKLIEPVTTPIGAAARSIGDGFQFASDKIKAFSGWIASFFQRETLSDEQKAEFSKAGYDVADAMINSIKDAFNNFIEWMKGIPQRIVEAIGTIDLSGIIQFPDVGGGFPALAAQLRRRPTALCPHRP
ncbi:phage tail tape measure protein [Devosia rhodophyticola]|uniref:Phage tail tape measure protein n=1 Tax=Devosia rhodophyticola TaxID=3026423 RepID=A0ABY7YW14_9HYPH|nr:phage tail tape measure protein [Devosia rhodophyticola]WDR05555.1 phage tail tape measure protein [Devosia rhodophyticola]